MSIFYCIYYLHILCLQSKKTRFKFDRPRKIDIIFGTSVIEA